MLPPPPPLRRRRWSWRRRWWFCCCCSAEEEEATSACEFDFNDARELLVAVRAAAAESWSSGLVAPATRVELLLELVLAPSPLLLLLLLSEAAWSLPSSSFEGPAPPRRCRSVAQSATFTEMRTAPAAAVAADAAVEEVEEPRALAPCCDGDVKAGASFASLAAVAVGVCFLWWWPWLWWLWWW